MRFVTPKVIRLAQTQIHPTGCSEFLRAVGAPDWTTDAETDGERLIEVAGRLCYRSFGTGLNPNVTRVREGNAAYVAGLLEQRHFSVLEHVSVTYAFLDVSRVFTHEMVRHRLAAFSQESLRYVRLTHLGAYWPEAFGVESMRWIARARAEAGGPSASDAAIEDEARCAAEALEETMIRTFEDLETTQRRLADSLGLDELPFAAKKVLTSAMRRLAPIGLTTAIIVTANLREWRHVVELRTSEHAEEEIRRVIGEVAADLAALYPHAMAGAGEA